MVLAEFELDQLEHVFFDDLDIDGPGNGDDTGDVLGEEFFRPEYAVDAEIGTQTAFEGFKIVLFIDEADRASFSELLRRQATDDVDLVGMGAADEEIGFRHFSLLEDIEVGGDSPNDLDVQLLESFAQQGIGFDHEQIVLCTEFTREEKTDFSAAGKDDSHCR
ncbi:MAG: hypothetical protein BWY66_02248 [bacterium ADurb.Bin374]|nr:MAG: hypothetical protein BWY66_02248 [bacterium ADurb.Bin374]